MPQIYEETSVVPRYNANKKPHTCTVYPHENSYKQIPTAHVKHEGRSRGGVREESGRRRGEVGKEEERRTGGGGEGYKQLTTMQRGLTTRFCTIGELGP